MSGIDKKAKFDHFVLSGFCFLMLVAATFTAIIGNYYANDQAHSARYEGTITNIVHEDVVLSDELGRIYTIELNGTTNVTIYRELAPGIIEDPWNVGDYIYVYSSGLVATISQQADEVARATANRAKGQVMIVTALCTFVADAVLLVFLIHRHERVGCHHLEAAVEGRFGRF